MVKFFFKNSGNNSILPDFYWKFWMEKGGPVGGVIYMYI